ncbi:hypothetical protein PMAYCL1PPCAC_09877, partial [Pristionchus mayeri]
SQHIMDLAKVLTVTVSAAAGVSVLTSLIIAGLLLHDINSFWDTQVHMLGEFKFFANDAWNEMIFANSQATTPSTSATRHLFKRHSISGLPAHCACSAGPNHCPPGPRGPRGVPGRPGREGEPGIEGQPGAYGMEMAMPISYRECISCPPGAAGGPGVDGEPGPQGKPGHAGYRGFPGKPGLWGPPGSRGEPGEIGRLGNDGYPGHAGANGRGGRGATGAPGRSGRPGRPGNAGRHGARGLDGTPGPQGPPGEGGQDGEGGKNGVDGAPGRRGAPGDDAQYCPCPRRVKNGPAVDFEEMMAAYTSVKFAKPAHEPPPSYKEPHHLDGASSNNQKARATTTGHAQNTVADDTIQHESTQQAYDQSLSDASSHDQKPKRPAQPKYEEIMNMLSKATAAVAEYDHPAYEEPIKSQSHGNTHDQHTQGEHETYSTPSRKDG